MQDEVTKKTKTDKNGAGDSQSTEISEKSSPADSLIDQTDLNESSNEAVIVDCDSVSTSSSQAYLIDDLGNRRRKHPTRGSKRGRPRGSRRGNRGALNRSDSAAPATLSTSVDSGIAPSESVSYETVANANINRVRRGPGRPRLKPNGPANQGNRAPYKYHRKPIGPLVVPLGSSPASTPLPSPSPSPSPHRGPGFRQQTSTNDSNL